MKIGLFIGALATKMNLHDQIKMIIDAEKRGFDSFWFAQTGETDVLTTIALAGKETENIEKPTDEVIPKTNPISEVSEVLPIAIIPIPTDAIIIDTQTFKEIFSFKNKKANNAVKKGIAAKHNKVIAALVFVIENIKEIIATPSPEPPTKPEIPILK